MAIVLDGTTGISASGNIIVGGTLSAGQFNPSSFSATGNVTGGNLVTAGGVYGDVFTTQIDSDDSSQITLVPDVQFLASVDIDTDLDVGQSLFVGASAVITGDLTMMGSAVIDGNLTVNGNLVYVNVNTLNVEDPIIGLGRGPNNDPLASNDGKDRGTQLWYFDGAERSAFLGYNNATGNMVVALDVTIAGEQITVIEYGNLVVGDVYAEDITAVGLLSAGNIEATQTVSGAVLSASGNVTAGNVITSGILVSSTVSGSGNIIGGNLITAGLISATGNVSGNNIVSTGVANVGSVEVLTTVSAGGNVTGSNLVTGGVVTATGNVVAGNILTGGYLAVTGNVSGGNLTTAGAVSAVTVTASGNISGSFLLGNGSQLTGIDATSIQNGTSNVRVISSGGNVSASIGGIDDVLVLSTAGAFVTGVTSATGNVTGGNLATAGMILATGNVSGGNVTTAGLVLATGNVSGGNLITAGLVDSGSVTATTTVSAGGNVTGGNIVTTGIVDSGSVTATGNIAGGNLTTAGLICATGNIAGGNLTTAGTVTATGNIAGGNLTTAGTVTATGNIAGGNLTTTGNLVAGNLVVSGIEAVTTLNVSGDTTIVGNLTVSGTTFTANVASLVITDPILGLGRGANGDPLTNNDGLDRGIEMFYYTTAEQTAFMGFDNNEGKMLSAANVSIANNTVTVNSYGTTVVGTLEGASVSVTGNVAGGNLTTAGAVTATGNITGGNLSGTSILGNLTTAAQTNITSVGTLTSLAVTGNVAGGNFIGTLNGSGANVTAISATNISAGTLAVARGGTGVTTSTGTGAVVLDTSPTFTTQITVPAIVKSGSNGVGNIGAAASSFNTVFAKATSSQYADVAEYYIADGEYPVGTVMVFGGDREVTQATASHDPAIAGVISDNPAVIMNSGLTDTNRALIALLGRVHCRVQGPVHKGDRLVAGSVPGVAVCLDPEQYQPGCMIGKALEDCVGTQETVIEVAVGRL